MGFWNFIVLMGGFFMTIIYLPQIFKNIKQKDTKELALWTYIFAAFGTFCYFLYFYLHHFEPIVTFWNVIALILALIVITQIFYYRKDDSLPKIDNTAETNDNKDKKKIK